MQLEDIPRLGAKRAQLLRQAGISDVKALAEIDLRRMGPIDGVTTDALKRHKSAARRLLDKNGVTYARSPYRSRQAGDSKTHAKRARQDHAPSRQNDASSPRRKRGIFGRLLGR